MRAIIVDDEAPARRRLERMLASVADVQVVASVADASQAREAVAEHGPDLVLLDIHMPEEDGLSLAASAALPAVIFVTAHDQYAVRAFELAAIDYLLKPVSQSRLEAALSRAKARGATDSEVLTRTLRSIIEDRPSATPRVTARCGSTWRVFDARQIARFSARDKYTLFHEAGEEFVLDHSLAALEQRLATHEFVRVHRSELVNLRFVLALHHDDAGHRIELRDGTIAPVSRRHVPTLKHRLGI